MCCHSSGDTSGEAACWTYIAVPTAYKLKFLKSPSIELETPWVSCQELQISRQEFQISDGLLERLNQDEQRNRLFICFTINVFKLGIYNHTKTEFSLQG